AQQPDELHSLGEAITLIGVDHEHEVLTHDRSCDSEPLRVNLRRLAADLELHADHAVLATEELEFPLKIRLTRSVIAADADHRDPIAVAPPELPERLVTVLADGIPHGAVHGGDGLHWQAAVA